MTTREERHALIGQIVSDAPVRSQDDLRHRLAERGTEVTQATLSRDLRELGVVKGPDGYGLPGESQGHARDRALREYVSGVEAVGPLVVVRTGPGQAPLRAAHLDDDPMPDTADAVAGTIAGDDTIFLAARTTGAARRVADRIAAAARLPKQTTANTAGRSA